MGKRGGFVATSGLGGRDGHGHPYRTVVYRGLTWLLHLLEPWRWMDRWRVERYRAEDKGSGPFISFDYDYDCV